MAHKAASFLEKDPFFQKSQHIACYSTFSDEFETQPIMELIWQLGKNCYLPVLLEGRAIDFSRYEVSDELILNQLGIAEPKDPSRKIHPEKLDLVICPVVAFDMQGHRLGTGGGYYDRTFAFMYDKNVSKPKMYGLAYACQQAESLPHDVWDITLQGIITEQALLLFT